MSSDRVILGEYRVSEPMRLDVFLALQKEIKSRSFGKRLAEDGLVLVNGKAQKKVSMHLESGDTVLVYDNPKKLAAKQKAAASTVPLEILYEDDACMVINKPAGISVHPGSAMEEDELTILAFLEHHFGTHGLPFSAGETLAHRLDKETTGCLLIAKQSKAHLLLQNQFRDRTVRKTYLALVAGVPAHKRAVIDSPIGRHVSERTRMSVLRSMSGRDAKTEYRTIATSGDVALLECDLHTGRTHQIRVHLSTIGHNLLGDRKYPSSAAQKLEDELAVKSLCLHAWKLSFDSPGTGKRVDVKAPVPEALRRVLGMLKMQTPD